MNAKVYTLNDVKEIFDIAKDEYIDGWDDAIDAIRTRKFEIEPWQGEWIGAGFLTSECSRCHHLFHELEAMNFCPNCGADMRKER